MAKAGRKRKGVFSDLRLPVAREYVYPAGRNRLLLIGGIGALLIAGVIGIDLTVGQGTSISNGPLSSSHALLQTDCASCHTAGQGVTDDKCSVCHEKFGDELGVFSFASHYLYRSSDFTRPTRDPGQVACFSCHPEHKGRDALRTVVPDRQCTSCHEYGSFNSRHPEFEFAAEEKADPANLTFSHTQHVNEVTARQELSDLEQTCLYCHRADPDGAAFQPISFDQACAACHISTSKSTAWLPIAAGSADPGVLTLQTLSSSGAPGTRWADYMNPGEFQTRRDEVRKRPVYHEDPWILANLNRLRSLRYPDSELASLLRLSADVPPDQARVLFEEALATLEERAGELRAEPGRNVQRALGEVDDLIAQVRARLRDPFAPLDETKFLTAHPSPQANTELAGSIDELVSSLTEVCQTCHQVSEGALARVQTSQRALLRADFDHRAHITQTGCLDCHSSIPIREYAARDSTAAPAVDHAGIQNLPTIETCQSCHAASKAADTCVTCHQFHADKSRHYSLLRYLD